MCIHPSGGVVAQDGLITMQLVCGRHKGVWNTAQTVDEIGQVTGRWFQRIHNMLGKEHTVGADDVVMDLRSRVLGSPDALEVGRTESLGRQHHIDFACHS